MSQNDLATWETMKTDLRKATLKLKEQGYPVEYDADDDIIHIRINPQPEKPKRKRKMK